jgi:hypothetical protein
MNFAYEGDEQHYVRFIVRLDAFTGHSLTHFRIGATYPTDPNSVHYVEGKSGPRAALVLWRDPVRNSWINIRSAAFGSSAAMKGTQEGHEIVNATNNNAPQFVFILNKETASQFESMEFFIVPIEPVATHADGQGYVMSYTVETPDEHGHFHGREVIASASVSVLVK